MKTNFQRSCKIIIPVTAIFLFILANVNAQAPEIEWQNTIGGNNSDYPEAMFHTSDNGLIIGGNTFSGISGDKTEATFGMGDFWIVKTDENGLIEWQNTIGGAGLENFYSLMQTTDGGYIIGGESSSGISGDKTESQIGYSDYWIIKLDVSGNIVWQNTIGGTGFNNLRAVEQTFDGGFIAGGFSTSGVSGDKTEASYGSYDYWILKLDPLGNIEWQNTIGGSSADYLSEIHQLADGGYIVGGYSGSGISGDKTEICNGLHDYWIVRLDNMGNSSGKIQLVVTVMMILRQFVKPMTVDSLPEAFQNREFPAIKQSRITIPIFG